MPGVALTSPQATYTWTSCGDLWTFTAYGALSSACSPTFTDVTDTPLATLVSGYLGCGFRLAQVPSWMWAGIGPVAAPTSETSTWMRLASSGRNRVVPLR